MDKKTVQVYSEKYSVNGEIVFYENILKMVKFCYADRNIEICCNYGLSDESDTKHGVEIMNNYIENYDSGLENKPRLFHWYIDDNYIAHGIVTGHTRLQDTSKARTSRVNQIILDKENDIVIIKTNNTVYNCMLEYCNFDKQDGFSSVLPNYEEIKSTYKNKLKNPIIEKGKLLLVISNFDYYYFNSVCCLDSNDNNIQYSSNPHIGMFQDSFLIQSKNDDFNCNEFDLRYFPHNNCIEFYSEETNGREFFIENIGNSTLHCQTSKGIIKLRSGERKKVCNENIELEKINLPDGDLYPAVFI